MKSALLAVALFVARDAAEVLPTPHDAHGWAVRVRGRPIGPYFAGEYPGRPPLEVLLRNTAATTRSYPDLREARKSDELYISISYPSGQAARRLSDPVVRRPGDLLPELRPGEQHSAKFEWGLGEFGYSRFLEPGVYKAQAVFRSLEGEVKSPPWKFEVTDIPPESVLVSHPVPLVGFRAKQPPAEQDKVVVQQVAVRGRLFLLYCRYAGQKYGGGIGSTARLAELPGKCEVTVEGAFGDDRPLTVTYKTSPDAKPTKLVINSVGGRPWTGDDEEALQERLKNAKP
jgi:hypothetical protein